MLGIKRPEPISDSYLFREEETYEGLMDTIREYFDRALRGFRDLFSRSWPVKVSPSIAERYARKMKVLRRGSRGDEVALLQRMLRSLGYNIAVDGIFGPQTERAVRDFQRKAGLVVDGIVGVRTWTKLISYSGIIPVSIGKPSKPLRPQPVTRPIPSEMKKEAKIQPVQRDGFDIGEFLRKNWVFLVIGGTVIAVLALSRR